MIHKKVLIVATYPIANPIHGGQKRTRAIVSFYEHMFTEVRFVAIFYSKHYADHGPGDIAIQDPNIIAKIDEDPFTNDILIGEAVYEDEHVRHALLEVVNSFKPDVIQVEQIYPFLGLDRIVKQAGLKPKLILSSQNIESRMKAEMYQKLELESKKSAELIEKISKLETAIIQKAQVVIAVSRTDADWLRAQGARKCIVAPNGIDKTTPTQAAVEHWETFKSDQRLNQLVTFVGSAHPPNLFGLQQMVGDNLSFLPPKTTLMLAGGISNYVQEVYGQDSPKAKQFWQKVTPLGSLSDDNLAGLIVSSDLLILPITSGGGSNLKTAEAILSGKKIVATSYAFRSYEKFISLPNIQIADNPADFQKAIVDALSRPYTQRDAEQISLAETVQWQYCLYPLANYLPRYLDGYLKTNLRRLRSGLKRLLNARA